MSKAPSASRQSGVNAAQYGTPQSPQLKYDPNTNIRMAWGHGIGGGFSFDCSIRTLLLAQLSSAIYGARWF